MNVRELRKALDSASDIDEVIFVAADPEDPCWSGVRIAEVEIDESAPYPEWIFWLKGK